MKIAPPARIHLLPARRKPLVIIIRRKPTKLFHILRWNTETDEIEQGSWFKGMLYPMRCDISFDGEWMIYLALGKKGVAWNGLCKPPWLKTIIDEPSIGTWDGGGYWRNGKVLVLNNWAWHSKSGRRNQLASVMPFTMEEQRLDKNSEDTGVLYHRWQRDGWTRCGENYGVEKVVNDDKTYAVKCVGDDGWKSQPSEEHPILRVRYAGYRNGYKFKFWLEGCPNLLDEKVDWVCWDALGQLVVAKSGIVSRYLLKDLILGKVSKEINLDNLEPKLNYSLMQSVEDA